MHQRHFPCTIQPQLVMLLTTLLCPLWAAWTLCFVTSAVALTGPERRQEYGQRLAELASRNISAFVPPFGNSSSGLIPIEIFFDLHRVISLNSDSATLSVSGVIVLSWTDDRYAWPAGVGLSSVLLPAKSMWVPELMLSTSVDFDIRFGKSNDVDVVRMHHDGRALIERPIKVDVVCEVNIQCFPRDVQHCGIVFAPPATHRDVLSLERKPRRGVNADGPTMGEEWRLLACVHSFEEIQVATADGSSVSVDSYQVNLLLYRNHAFYFITIIIPSIMLSVVTLVPYILPPSQSSQKLIIPISVFLSFNIYMLLLEKSLPKSSSIPVLGQSYATLLAVTTITELFQAVSVKFYSCRIKHIPRPVIILYLRILATICCFRSCHGNSHIKEDDGDLECGGQDNSKLVFKNWLTMGRINDRVGLVISLFIIVCAYLYLLATCYVKSIVPPSFRKYDPNVNL